LLAGAAGFSGVTT